MYPHFTVRVTPSCHDWHRRIAISDIVDLSVPMKPMPPDWMTASMRTGYLFTKQAHYERTEIRKDMLNAPSSIHLFCLQMIRIFPSQHHNVDPPCRIDFIACHDNIFHNETFLRPKLFLYFTYTTCIHRQGSEAIFDRDLPAPRRKVMVADMDSNILFISTEHFEIR